MIAFRVAVACLVIGAAAPTPAHAEGLDGTWRGTTSGGNCRPFTFEVRIRDGSLHLEQVSSQACNPTRAGDLKRS